MSASSPAQVLALYRAILRAAQRFPSIKKQAIIADIKQQFREHRVRRGWCCRCGWCRARLWLWGRSQRAVLAGGCGGGRARARAAMLAGCRAG